MSVMECRREGCEHILCRRYSSEYGYICDSCFEELIEFLKTNPSTDPLHYRIELFMNSKKLPRITVTDNTREQLETIFWRND